jgi:opacity protein-like surface antigen
MKKLLILFYLITLLSLPNKAYCNDKPTDIRTTYSVGESFCTNVPKHSLIKSEISYGRWYKDNLRLGTYFTPFWEDGYEKSINSVESGFDCRFVFLKHKRISLGIDTSIGILYSDSKYPTNKASTFNFTFGTGLISSFMLTETYSFELGYEYSHYSNANLYNENPGIDYQSVTFGISYYFK